MWEKREVSKLNFATSKLNEMFVRFKNWVTSESTQSDQKFMMCVFRNLQSITSGPDSIKAISRKITLDLATTIFLTSNFPQKIVVAISRVILSQ